MRRSLLVSLCLLLVPGCSFWAVRGADPLVTGGGDCTTSVAVPVLDGVLAAGLVGLGTASMAAGAKEDPWGFNKMYQGMAAGLLVLGVAETVSTIVGAKKVSSCHDARKHAPPPGVTPVRPAPAVGLGVESAS